MFGNGVPGHGRVGSGVRWTCPALALALVGFAFIPAPAAEIIVGAARIPFSSLASPVRQLASGIDTADLSPPELAAVNDLEAALLQLRQFAQFESPLRLQQYDGQIVSTQAEIAGLERRLAEYSKFSVWNGNSNPLYESVERVRLAWTEAVARLQLVQSEKALYQRGLPAELRQRQLQVEIAERRFGDLRRQRAEEPRPTQPKVKGRPQKSPPAPAPAEDQDKVAAPSAHFGTINRRDSMSA